METPNLRKVGHLRLFDDRALVLHRPQQPCHQRRQIIKNHRFGIIETAGVNFSALMAPAWPAPDRPMVPPCSVPSRRGLEALEGALVPECRPALTAPARGGGRDLWSGRKKACGAVEQKKGTKRRERESKLASVATMRERKNARPRSRGQARFMAGGQRSMGLPV